MSGQVHQRRTHYLGIINGIVFRIDGVADGAGGTIGLVSLETETMPTVKEIAAAPRTAAPAAQAALPLSGHVSSVVAETSGNRCGAAETVGEAHTGKAESPVTLFPRDGADPLRAGHPDLWNLLVAGTCLEGSTFRST